jgi:hypothetical protein
MPPWPLQELTLAPEHSPLMGGKKMFVSDPLKPKAVVLKFGTTPCSVTVGTKK